MSDFEMNLAVVTQYLEELGAKHQHAADQITGANRLVADSSSKIESTHGLICWATIQALAGDEPRKAAGETLVRVSTEFEEKLARAARNYNDVDYREGRSIGEAGDACRV
jgi:hypothetical protein